LKETLLSIAVLVSILVVSALITNWFAAAMYIRCAVCGTLNAKRRTACRSCEQDLRSPPIDN
jgi:formate dehydrogenase maturation protein FdhE